MTPDERALRKVLRKLIGAVQSFADDKYFDDEEGMERSGSRVDDAMREASRVILATGPKRRRMTSAPRSQQAGEVDAGDAAQMKRSVLP